MTFLKYHLCSIRIDKGVIQRLHTPTKKKKNVTDRYVYFYFTYVLKKIHKIKEKSVKLLCSLSKV